HGAGVGVYYAIGNVLSANRIFANTTGVIAIVNSTTDGFGFKGSADANQIFGNITGVQLTGRMQGQHIYSNNVGVRGVGILGPESSLDQANVIERNDIGVSFSGIIQFNRIARNRIGIAGSNGLQVLHNLIYRNSQDGILVDNVDTVQIFNNTFYSQT